MAVEIFLKLGDKEYEGESAIKGFEKQIELLHYNWGSSQSATTHSGTGSGSGKANVGDISIGKFMDKSTPPLYKSLLLGTHISTGKITVRKVSGGVPLDYLVIEMENIIIASYNTGGGAGGDDRIMESLSLNFGKFKMIYTVQGAKGAADSKIPVQYDIARGTAD